MEGIDNPEHQPSIMVEVPNFNWAKNGDADDKTVDEKDDRKPKVTFAKKNRQHRPQNGGWAWCGSDSSSTLIVRLWAAVAFAVALIALLLGALGLVQRGDIFVNVTQAISASEKDTMPTQEADNRVWTFAIGDFNNKLEYVESQSGQVKGYNIDVVNAVCRIAKKNCKLEWDDYSRCWQSTNDGIERQGGGAGLLGRWYDACTGWLATYRRARTFAFTNAHSKQHLAVFMVKTGTPEDAFNWRNLTGKTIGFLRYFSEDEDCIRRQTEIEGNLLTEARFYESQQDLLSAVNNGEVDAVFISEFLSVASLLQLASGRIDRCALRAESMMTRKDSTLSSWWNPALATLIASQEYHIICRGLDDENVHGTIPGPAANAVCIGY